MLHPLRIFTVLLSFLVSAISCQPGTTEADSNAPLSAKDFAALMQKSEGALLLDVRTSEEFNAGHLKNAQNVDFLASDFMEKIKSIDQSKPVFVYCASGKRSAKAAEALQKAGFKQVIDLDGGIKSWFGAKFPIE